MRSEILSMKKKLTAKKITAKNLLAKILISLTVLTISACGRYEPPVPAEAVGPEMVKDLSVTAEPDGVRFAFRSSEKDARGKPLKTLDEYRIYRKELTEEDHSLFKVQGYELLTAIKDEHLPVLFQLQEDARKAGKSPRRVQVPNELLSFTYKDSTLVPGSEYGYKIIGVNQANVESDAQRIISVGFDGLESEILIIR